MVTAVYQASPAQPQRCGRAHRGAAGELRHARGARAARRARVSRALPLRPARGGAAARAVAAGAVRCDPAFAAAARRAQVPADLDRGRLAAARADRAAARRTRRAAQRLAPLSVEVGMLYSAARATRALERLRDSGAQRLLVLPLFPQYCAATTGAVYDQVSASCAAGAGSPSCSSRGLPRPARLHRGAARERHGALGGTRPHRASADVLPRHPGAHVRPGTPTSATATTARACSRTPCCCATASGA